MAPQMRGQRDGRGRATQGETRVALSLSLCLSLSLSLSLSAHAVGRREREREIVVEKVREEVERQMSVLFFHHFMFLFDNDLTHILIS